MVDWVNVLQYPQGFLVIAGSEMDCDSEQVLPV